MSGHSQGDLPTTTHMKYWIWKCLIWVITFVYLISCRGWPDSEVKAVNLFICEDNDLERFVAVPTGDFQKWVTFPAIGYHANILVRVTISEWLIFLELDLKELTLFQQWKELSSSSISKMIFYSGGMTPSECTCSVRAVRDTPVPEYSALGVNTSCRVVYRPLIAVSPFLRVLAVSHFKWSLWRCGQLWPYIGMGSLGTRLHQDCNAMGDAAIISPSVPFACAQNAILSLLIICIILSRQIYVAIDNPSLVPSVSCLTTSSNLWNYIFTADNVSHAENLQSNGCQCFSHLYKFRDRIQVTRVFRYCGEHQG